jgi:hypothetical protein
MIYDLCMKKIDWTGYKFYKLTFVKSTNKLRSTGTGHGGTIWEALCDCGNTFNCEPQRVKSGNCKSCGCWRKEQSSKGVQRKHEPRISSAMYVWRRAYKDCDFNLFLELSQKDCYYCSRSPYRIFNAYSSKKSEYQKENGSFTYNGLDRLNSDLGHTPNNIVPCCTECNKAKLDMSEEHFLKLIEMIYRNRLQSHIE